MKIDLKNQVKSDFGTKPSVFQTITNDIESKLKPRDTEATIELFLVSDEKIKQINKQYRDKDEVTDVLSFPQADFPAQERVLGTIFIAPIFGNSQGTSAEILFVHGMLHLLGYDHEKDERDWIRVENIINLGAI